MLHFAYRPKPKAASTVIEPTTPTGDKTDEVEHIHDCTENISRDASDDEYATDSAGGEHATHAADQAEDEEPMRAVELTFENSGWVFEFAYHDFMSIADLPVRKEYMTEVFSYIAQVLTFIDPGSHLLFILEFFNKEAIESVFTGEELQTLFAQYQKDLNRRLHSVMVGLAKTWKALGRTPATPITAAELLHCKSSPESLKRIRTFRGLLMGEISGVGGWMPVVCRDFLPDDQAVTKLLNPDYREPLRVTAGRLAKLSEKWFVEKIVKDAEDRIGNHSNVITRQQARVATLRERRARRVDLDFN